MECEEDILEHAIVLVLRCYLSLRVDNTRIYVNEHIVCQMSVFRRQTLMRLFTDIFPYQEKYPSNMWTCLSTHLKLIDAPKKTSKKEEPINLWFNAGINYSFI